MSIVPIHPDDLENTEARRAIELADELGVERIAARLSLGMKFPSRRTLGRKFPSRRTLGRNLPSRRTLMPRTRI